MFITKKHIPRRTFLRGAGVTPGVGMAVIGFRDSPITRHLVPHITSFTTSLRDLGEALGENLLSRMPDHKHEYPNVPAQRIWPMELVERESDPPIKPARKGTMK